MQTIGERLTYLINVLGFSKLGFSQKIGASQTFVNKVTNNSAGLSANLLKKIHQAFPTVNPTWILTGVGAMMLEASGLSVVNEDQGLIYLIGEGVKNYHFCTEDITKRNIGANFRAAVERWNMYDYELWEILDPEVPRTGISRLHKGISRPGNVALLKFEAMTGIPIGQLFTRVFLPEEFPQRPIPPGDHLSILLADLRRCQERIESFISERK